MDGEGVRLVFKKMDAVLGKVLFDEGAGFAHVVVTVDGEGAEAGFDLSEDWGKALDGAGPAIDEVSGQGDEIGVEVRRNLCRAGEEREGCERFAVEVGKLNDAEPLEGGGELGKGD